MTRTPQVSRLSRMALIVRFGVVCVSLSIPACVIGPKQDDPIITGAPDTNTDRDTGAFESKDTGVEDISVIGLADSLGPAADASGIPDVGAPPPCEPSDGGLADVALDGTSDGAADGPTDVGADGAADGASDAKLDTSDAGTRPCVPDTGGSK